MLKGGLVNQCLPEGVKNVIISWDDLARFTWGNLEIASNLNKYAASESSSNTWSTVGSTYHTLRTLCEVNAHMCVPG